MRISRLITVAALALAPSLASAQPAKPDTSKIDLAGNWTVSVQSDVGSGTPTITFYKAKGDSISGTYISNTLGRHDFVGTLKAGRIVFGFTAGDAGTSFSMNFSGIMENPDTMSGSIDFAGMGSGTFSGKRIKP
jgi:hypothetical protein